MRGHVYVMVFYTLQQRVISPHVESATFVVNPTTTCKQSGLKCEAQFTYNFTYQYQFVFLLKISSINALEGKFNYPILLSK